MSDEGIRSEAILAFTVKVSVVVSPKVVLFSTVKVEAVVVERVTPPEVVREWAKTSPSASIRNIGEALMAMPRRLVSVAAEAGLITKEALVTLELETPVAQEEKVWAPIGTPLVVNWLVTVEVELMVRVWPLAVKLPAILRGPAKLEVAVPFTVKVPPMVVLPVISAVPPMVELPVKVEAPETERVSKVPPDLTVKLPFTSALFERMR